MSARIPDRPLVDPPSQTPGGRSTPSDADPATEAAALAALLAEAVQLADNSALFPSRWTRLAELALEHDSVRAALQATDQTDTSAPLNTDIPPLSTEHIIAQLNGLHNLIRDGRVMVEQLTEPLHGLNADGSIPWK